MARTFQDFASKGSGCASSHSFARSRLRIRTNIAIPILPISRDSRYSAVSFFEHVSLSYTSNRDTLHPRQILLSPLVKFSYHSLADSYFIWTTSSWLCIMRFCGIHLPTYIEREKQLGFDLGPRMWERYRSTKIIEMINVQGMSVPSWTWTIDRESKIYEVLEEFKNLGPGAFSCYTYGPDAVLDHHMWKYSCWPEKNFPFIVRPIPPGLRHLHHSYLTAINLAMARFERRQAKKTAKRDGVRYRKKKTIMPGSWIEC